MVFIQVVMSGAGNSGCVYRLLLLILDFSSTVCSHKMKTPFIMHVACGYCKYANRVDSTAKYS